MTVVNLKNLCFFNWIDDLLRAIFINSIDLRSFFRIITKKKIDLFELI